jgi:CRP-like cAMP-binding protein
MGLLGDEHVTGVTEVSGRQLPLQPIQRPGQALFGNDQIELLRAAGRSVTFKRGEILLTEGAHSGRTFLIEQGQVKVTASSLNGYTTLLAFRGPGELIGELSALDNGTRSGTATAISGVEAIAIPAAHFRSLLAEHGELALAVLKSVIARLRDSDRRRAEFGSHSTRARVASLLVELVDNLDTPEPRAAKVIVVTQQELAGAVGTSRESVVRSLRELRRDGLVETSRGKVTVLDRDLLAGSIGS